MTYTDIYQFPLHKPKYGSWVYDEKGNFVFQFERQYDEKGEYQDGWIDFENKILNKLNGDKSIVFDEDFTFNNIEIYYKGLHIITIRGWGNLTGTGAHNLSSENAANIQDTFRDFIIETLNN
jgi:hypothetical protein